MDSLQLKTEKDDIEVQFSDINEQCYILNEIELADEDNEAIESVEEDEEDEEDDSAEVGEDDTPGHVFLEGIDVDYLAEAINLLQSRDEVCIENALVINRQMQTMLQALREKVVLMLKNCREKYVKNQEILANPAGPSISLRGIGSCAAPFFKDINGKPCPPNDDYIYRSTVEKEFFPIDLKLLPTVIWTATDKLGVLQGIKEQLIEHIERKEMYPTIKLDTKAARISKNVKLHTLILADLLQQVDDDFTIDWNQISVYNLKSRHSANSCYAMWNVYLKPDIKRSEWTEEENIKLNQLAKKYKFQDWEGIASEMDGRSDYQCFVQYQTVVSTQMREDKGKAWTKEEDERLLWLVEQHSVGNVIRWNPICSQFPNRSKKQCFARYRYSINPTISRAPFTQEEDCTILAAVEEYGENFTCFARSLFPNRTVVQIRNRYFNSIKCRETMRCWTPEDDEILLKLVSEYGTREWKKISQELNRHSRTGCRTRFLVISKFLKENPHATVNDLPRKKRMPLSTVTKKNWMEKITEIKQNDGNEKSTKKAIDKPQRKEAFRDRLRANELKWYDYFKYSFDFQFGKPVCKAAQTLKSHEFVRRALDVTVQLPFQLEKPYTYGVVRVTLKKLARKQDELMEIDKHDMPDVGYVLPPNYSLLLAFRGLCIQTAGCKELNNSPDQPSDEFREAAKKFRQRLHSLLYKTTLLSRLDPNTVVEKTNFVIQLNSNVAITQAIHRDLAEVRAAQTQELAQNLKIVAQKAKRKRELLASSSQSVSKKLKASEG